jgi:hypothetical protein
MSSIQQTFDSAGDWEQSGGIETPQFVVGERVVDTATESDRDNDTIEFMRVIDPNAGKAGEIAVEVEDTEVAVSEYQENTDIDSDDRVVECVYESYLDGYVSGWSDSPASNLSEYLSTFSEKWQVPIRSYFYPEKHLSTADEKD